MSNTSGPRAGARSLTIALINNLYPPYIVGGNEILARDVVQGLRARGHTVHVLTGRGRMLPNDGFTHPALDLDLDQKEGLFMGGLPLTLRRLVQWHLYNRRTHRQVQRTLELLQPDLVIAWNLYMASAAPLIAARGGPWPVIAHPADKWLLYSLNDIRKLVPATTRLTKLALNVIHRCVQPVLRRRARPDYILAVSEFIRALHTQAGYAPRQSVATFLGIHAQTFAAAPHAHPGDRTWRLLYAGQLWWGKGPQVAIEAIRLLRERSELPRVELDIYGGGAEQFKGYLQGLINEKGLAECVRLCGFAPQADLAAAMRSHDAYLFTSIWDEPFSGGLLEAMATGLPTIATTAGGTPEAVRHEQNGLLVPPDNPQALAEAIARLITEPELYARLGPCAAEDVRLRWPFDAFLDRLESAYGAIVAGHSADSPVDLTLLPGVRVKTA